jgi:hypothetical protein
MSGIKLNRHSTKIRAPLRVVAAAVAAASACAVLASPARAQTAADYVAAGYALIRQTTLPGPFTGCEKDQVYTFADGSNFECTEHRTAFAVDPRVQFLLNGDETIGVVLIDSRPYAGQMVLLQGGVRSHSFITVTDAPDVAKPGMPSIAIGPIAPVETILPVQSLRDNAQLQSDESQNYPPHPLVPDAFSPFKPLSGP